MLMCYVCVFSLHREFPDMILGDKPLLFQGGSITFNAATVNEYDMLDEEVLIFYFWVKCM
jgi:hypothetical protein